METAKKDMVHGNLIRRIENGPDQIMLDQCTNQTVIGIMVDAISKKVLHGKLSSNTWLPKVINLNQS